MTHSVTNDRHHDLRARAFDDLRRFEVVMEGHFDFGNGFHGRLYLNPHQLFQLPSTIWRVAQDLIDVMPSELSQSAQVIAGPATGGALLAHTMAGLLDGRRTITHPPYRFAPLGNADGRPTISDFYKKLVAGQRVLLADDVRNTGHTLKRCGELIKAAGGEVVATVVIIDRCEVEVSLGVPNISLIDYKAPPNYAAGSCPMCAAGRAITHF
jgi:orotate phosphoribosyltransferase